jgi:hypothetical protein
MKTTRTRAQRAANVRRLVNLDRIELKKAAVSIVHVGLSPIEVASLVVVLRGMAHDIVREIRRLAREEKTNGVKR